MIQVSNGMFRKCVTCGVERPMSELNAQGVCIAHRTPIKNQEWAQKESRLLEKAERQAEGEKQFRCESCSAPISLKEHKMKGLCRRCLYKAFQ